MRSIQLQSSARLYHLDGDGGVATTLFYGSVGEALALAAARPAAEQDDLFLQTADDVVSYRDLVEG